MIVSLGHRAIASRHTARRYVPSIRAGKPSHSEFDAVSGKLAPGFDLGHVGRLGKAAKHFPRLLPRFLARQRESLASKRVARARTQPFRRAAGDIGGTATGTHDSSIYKSRAERLPRRVVTSLVVILRRRPSTSDAGAHREIVRCRGARTFGFGSVLNRWEMRPGRLRRRRAGRPGLSFDV